MVTVAVEGQSEWVSSRSCSPNEGFKSRPLSSTTKRLITGRFGGSSHVADRREGKDVRIFADTTVVTVWEQGMEMPS